MLKSQKTRKKKRSWYFGEKRVKKTTFAQPFFFRVPPFMPCFFSTTISSKKIPTFKLFLKIKQQ